MAKPPRYFTHYWSDQTVGWNRKGNSNKDFLHAASNIFRDRGVDSGDFVYGWSFSKGKLLLLGRMEVGRFVTQKEADALYSPAGSRAWPAKDHVFAASGTASPIYFNLTVPTNIIRKLLFVSPTGQVTPAKFTARGTVDPQTFRSVRELKRESALLLDGMLTLTSSAHEKPLDQIINSDLESLQAEESVFKEGGRKIYYTNRFERDPKLRAAAIKAHGTACKACNFDFGNVYGERGVGFIEVHHLRPVSALTRKTQINPKNDMTVVCSNCHRMIHRRKDEILSLEELKRTFVSVRRSLTRSQQRVPGHSRKSTHWNR